MFPNNHEGVININQLPPKIRPPCQVSDIVPLMTYRDPKNKIDEILNATCHNGVSCPDPRCPFKGFVDLDK